MAPRAPARTTSKQTLGRVGERIAARHLERLGLVVVQRNWRPAGREVRGELDLILLEQRTLVVCEVKARRGDHAGGALAAVTPRKQAQVRRLATAYLVQERPRVEGVRFDVVGVTWPATGGRAVVDHVRAVC